MSDRKLSQWSLVCLAMILLLVATAGWYTRGENVDADEESAADTSTGDARERDPVLDQEPERRRRARVGDAPEQERAGTKTTAPRSDSPTLSQSPPSGESFVDETTEWEDARTEAEPTPEPITIRGVLTRTDGGAPEEVSVRYIAQSGTSWHQFRAAVDADGSFSMDVPADRVGDILTILAGVGSEPVRAFEVPRERVDEGIAIEVPRAVVVRGTVVDENSDPLAGVSISTWYNAVDHAGSTTGDDGTFAITMPGESEGMFWVGGLGRPKISVYWNTRMQTEVDLGHVPLLTGVAVRGTIVGADGEPIDPQSITLYESTLNGRARGQTTSNEAGEFAIGGIGSGPYEVAAHFRVDKQEYIARASGVTRDTEMIRLVARPVRRMTLRLLDHVNFEPVNATRACVEVRPVDPPAPPWKRYFSPGANAAVGLDLESPGIYDIVTMTVWHAYHTHERVEIAGEDLVLDVPLAPR